MAGDALAQRRGPERLRVTDAAVGERRPGGLADGPRRGRGGLADLHMDDVGALPFFRRGRRQYVHGEEGRHARDAGRRTRPSFAIVRHRFPPWNRLAKASGRPAQPAG